MQAVAHDPTTARAPRHQRQPRARTLESRPAGPDHQVSTVAHIPPASQDSGSPASGRVYMRRPCGGCPWKVANAGTFPAEAFEHSARTAYDMAEHQFACHEAGVDTPALCAGYLLRGSAHNLAARLDILAGRLDPAEIQDGDHELFGSYRDMAVANGVAPDSNALRPCR